MIRRATVVALVVLGAAVTGCGDGRSGFCDTLESNADLEPLATAIATGDTDKAASEARRLVDLSEEAPPEVRADLRELAEAISAIVGHLEQQISPSADPADAERQREEINERLGTLDRRIERVSTWAERECGLRLS